MRGHWESRALCGLRQDATTSGMQICHFDVLGPLSRPAYTQGENSPACLSGRDCRAAWKGSVPGWPSHALHVSRDGPAVSDGTDSQPRHLALTLLTGPWTGSLHFECGEARPRNPRLADPVPP
jgi:hypothetical protein